MRGMDRASHTKKGGVMDDFFSLQALARKEERKTTQAAKSCSHQLRKRGHLGRKAPSPGKKEAVSEDQEVCGQTS